LDLGELDYSKIPLNRDIDKDDLIELGPFELENEIFYKG